MMHAVQQSDAAIVALKPANKGTEVLAEPARAKGRDQEESATPGTGRTQSRVTVSTGAERIRQFARANPEEKLSALLHHLTPETLDAAYLALKPNAAPGADGITWHMYGEDLIAKLGDLCDPRAQGNVSGDPRPAGSDTQTGRRGASARHRRSGGQDRPARGGRQPPEPDLRIGVRGI